MDTVLLRCYYGTVSIDYGGYGHDSGTASVLLRCDSGTVSVLLRCDSGTVSVNSDPGLRNSAGNFGAVLRAF